jgi:DNA polymerase-1
MIIKPTLKQAYDLFHKGILCFSDMEDEGICVDKKYYKKTYEKLTKRVRFLVQKISEMEPAQMFKLKTGKDIISFDTKLHVSHQDLSKLFFRFMGMKPIKFTEKENVSSDDVVLEKIGTPFTKEILKVKKLEKNRTTYIGGIKDLATLDNDGLWKIHPSFNLHIPRSYRSSSDSPNFQNIPAHDEESRLLVRTGIIPRPGNKLGWADYGGHEVRIMACYSHDPELMRMINNGEDPHQEWADYLGTNRFDAKNSFVFALAYGSYYKSIYASLTSDYPKLSERRVELAEREFWKKFKVLKQWQEELIRSYYRNGYIEMLTGFRCIGVLSHNQIVNTPVQGTAFHLLLWSCIELNRIRKEENWETKIPGQIHDEIFMDIKPEEENDWRKNVEWVMVEGTRKTFPWIIVPLQAEYGSGEINQPWIVKK